MKENIKDAILAFNDNWCAQCYTEKKVLNEFIKQNPEINLIKNYDAEKDREIFEKFNVKHTPTIIFIKDGKVIEEFRHYLDLKQLTQVVNYYFKEKFMTDKKKDVQKPKFEVVNNDNNLSAGVCGPDGCVIDWSKAEDNK